MRRFFFRAPGHFLAIVHTCPIGIHSGYFRVTAWVSTIESRKILLRYEFPMNRIDMPSSKNGKIIFGALHISSGDTLRGARSLLVSKWLYRVADKGELRDDRRSHCNLPSPVSPKTRLNAARAHQNDYGRFSSPPLPT